MFVIATLQNIGNIIDRYVPFGQAATIACRSFSSDCSETPSPRPLAVRTIASNIAIDRRKRTRSSGGLVDWREVGKVEEIGDGQRVYVN